MTKKVSSKNFYLIIHTAAQKAVFICLVNQGIITAKKQFQAQYQQAEKLLVEIDKLFKTYSLKLITLKGIAVVTGPGPFTALRIGVATANTMAWALKIPVVGIKLIEFKDIKRLVEISEEKIKKTKAGSIIEPFYGKEPNITKKK